MPKQKRTREQPEGVGAHIRNALQMLQLARMEAEGQHSETVMLSVADSLAIELRLNKALNELTDAADQLDSWESDLMTTVNGLESDIAELDSIRRLM